MLYVTSLVHILIHIKTAVYSYGFLLEQYKVPLGCTYRDTGYGKQQQKY